MMSGLPGVGKSAIADELGVRLRACVVSVDPIEAALLRSGYQQSFGTGLAAYLVGAAVAEHQLRLGTTVIADAANYLEVGREIWRSAAERTNAVTRVIEVVCSDEALHRQRLTNRTRDLGSFGEPTWDEVVVRRGEAEPWGHDHLVLDSVEPTDVNVRTALEFLDAS